MKLKRFNGAILIALIFFSSTIQAFAYSDSNRPTENIDYQMISCYPGGHIYYDSPGIPVAQSDQNVYSGILFKGWNITKYSTINQANLTVYYYNNIDYGTNSTTLLINGIMGSPSSLSWDTVVNGYTTSAHVSYNISQWTSEGYYTIDITDILQELVSPVGYTQGDNFIIRMFNLAPTGPGADPTFYRYDIGANHDPLNALRPTLSVDYSDPPTTEYKGWTITPVNRTGYTGIFANPQGSDPVRLYTRDLNTSWEFIELPFTDLPSHNGKIGAFWNNTLYFFGNNGTGYLHLFSYESNIITDLGQLPDGAEDWVDWTCVYFESENTLYLFAGFPLRVDYWKYYLDNNTISNSSLLWTGGATYGVRGMDAIVDDDRIYLAVSARTAGSSNLLVRFMQYFNGTWEKYSMPSPYSAQNVFPSLSFTDEGNVSMVLMDTNNIAIKHYYGVVKQSSAYNDWGSYTSLGNDGAWLQGVATSGFDALNNITYFSYIQDSADQYVRTYTLQGGTWTFIGDALTFPGLGDDMSRLGSMTYNNTPYMICNIDGEGIYAVPFTFYGAHTEEEWAYYAVDDNENFFETGYTNTISAPSGVVDYWDLTEGGGFSLTPPANKTQYLPCVESYLSGISNPSLEDVQNAIDSCTNWVTPPDPGEDPDPGSWSTSLKSFKLYFLLIGVSMIVIPWILFALTKDMEYIAWILLLNALGAGLLIEFMRL